MSGDPRHTHLLAQHPERIELLRRATASDPLRILVSGCLAGLPCGVDGTDYGLATPMRALLALPTVQAIAFCPEEHALGTPRSMPDIHGGDGFAVLEGQARVLDEHGRDLTAPMLAGAQAMLERAQASRAELAILTDMSAACGSQVISDGCRLVEQRRYRIGVGVAAALLLRAEIPIVSQRDDCTLGRIRARLDPDFAMDPRALDHHQKDWYRDYFQLGG